MDDPALPADDGRWGPVPDAPEDAEDAPVPPPPSPPPASRKERPSGTCVNRSLRAWVRPGGARASDVMGGETLLSASWEGDFEPPSALPSADGELLWVLLGPRHVLEVSRAGALLLSPGAPPLALSQSPRGVPLPCGALDPSLSARGSCPGPRAFSFRYPGGGLGGEAGGPVRFADASPPPSPPRASWEDAEPPPPRPWWDLPPPPPSARPARPPASRKSLRDALAPPDQLLDDAPVRPVRPRADFPSPPRGHLPQAASCPELGARFDLGLLPQHGPPPRETAPLRDSFRGRYVGQGLNRHFSPARARPAPRAPPRRPSPGPG